MTELSPVVTFASPDDWTHGSGGQVVSNTEMKVFVNLINISFLSIYYRSIQ